MTDALPEVPVTITLGGSLPVDLLVVLELDDGGQVELTPEQARAIGAGLIEMADEAER